MDRYKLLLESIPKIIEDTVTKTTEKVLATLNAQQDKKEKHVDSQFQVLEEQLSRLSNQVKPSSNISTVGRTSPSLFGNSSITFEGSPTNICQIHDKTKNSKKTSRNH